MTLEYKEIKTETDKAICFIMIGDGQQWFPKKHIKVKHPFVFVEEWLIDKIITEKHG